jgi:hypothetical protein
MAFMEMHHGGTASKDIEGSALHHEAFLDLRHKEEIAERMTTNLPRAHIAHCVYHTRDDVESTLKKTEKQQARRERLYCRRAMTLMHVSARITVEFPIEEG